MEQTTSTPKPRAPLNQQRGGYSAELENWLRSNAAMMGERSNLPGLVAAIERGVDSGNKGTKGVGVVRIEPFTQCACVPQLPGEPRITGVRRSCPTCSFNDVRDRFDRSDRCWMAWRGMTDYERDLAAARYIASSKKLPAGMTGQLGDLAAVAYVVAERLGLLGRLLQDCARQKWRHWEDVCAMAVESMHASWREERAQADRDADAEGVES